MVLVHRAAPRRAPPAAPLGRCRRRWAGTKEGPAGARRAAGPQGPLQCGVLAFPQGEPLPAPASSGTGRAWRVRESGLRLPTCPATHPCKGAGGLSSGGGGLSGELGREPFLHSRPCRSWRPEKAVRGTRHLRLLCHSSTQRSWPLRFRAAGDMSTNSREEVTPALGPRHVTTVTFTLCTCQWGCRCLPRLVHFHIQQTFPRAPPHALRQHWAGGSSLMPMTQPCPGWAKPTDLRTGVQGGVGERRDCRADTLMDTPENPGVGRGL